MVRTWMRQGFCSSWRSGAVASWRSVVALPVRCRTVSVILSVFLAAPGGMQLCLAGKVQRASRNSFSLSPKDEGMLQFVLDAWNDSACFDGGTALPNDLLACFSWMKSRSMEEAMLGRETVISAIEKDARNFIISGERDAWFGNADYHTRHIGREVNGPLLEKLLRVCEHVDLGCANLFRDGAPLFGELPFSGTGTWEVKGRLESIGALRASAAEGNAAVIKRLREHEHSAAVFEKTLEEVSLGLWYRWTA